MPPFTPPSPCGLDWDSLPPLATSSTPRGGAGSTLLEGLASLQEDAKLYCLALVDDEGQVVREASDEDLLRLGKHIEASQPKPKQQQQQQAEAIPSLTFQQLLAQQAKNGGPQCMHCFACESPQWRRGPPEKPILCNACGTRYRRTNQLGSAVPSSRGSKRGAASQACARSTAGQQPPLKQPRIAAVA